MARRRNSSMPRPLMMALLLLIAFVTWRCLRSISFINDGGNIASGRLYAHYPEEVFASDWSENVVLHDQLHHMKIQKRCMEYKDSVIDRFSVLHRNDPHLLHHLKKCTKVDIFVPGGLRGHGYCEDAAAYVKFLHGRMLPGWVQDFDIYDPSLGRSVRYIEICPATPTIFFNHYYDQFLDESVWPKTKKMILMPNMEMYELQAEQFRRPDIILCKTAICMRYLTYWFGLHGNPRNTKVIYTRHTSTDPSAVVRINLGSNPILQKQFKAVSFVHTAGTSNQKGTSRIFDCWLQRPDLPLIHVYMSRGVYEGFREQYESQLNTSTNIRLHVGGLTDMEFGHLLMDNSFFLCPSFQEGYGHYINQARASGSLIVSTDVAPMNELITPTSGVLIRAHAVSSEQQFLGGTSKHPLGLRGVPGFIAEFAGRDVCTAVDHVTYGMTRQERQNAAERARQQYYFDLAFFARAMKHLRLELHGDEGK